MTIEFADPGYNWAFVWWPLGVLALAIVVMVCLTLLNLDEIAETLSGPILGIPVAAMLCFPTLFGIMFYGAEVDSLKRDELTSAGFSNVALYGGDRFTAATEDGQYFRGVLVDLEPDEGYAYQVLELNGTEN